MRKLMEKVGGNWLFFSVMVILYLVVYCFSATLVNESLDYFVKLFIKILPVLVLVFSLIFLGNLFVSRDSVLKHLGHDSGLKGWTMAIVLGVISSGPVYMWYPLLADLKEKGMKNSLIAAFIYSRAVKIPLIPIMVYYFDWYFVVVLTIYMLVFSVLVGFFTDKFLTLKP